MESSIGSPHYAVNCPQCNAVVKLVCPRSGAQPVQVKEVTPVFNKAATTTSAACPQCDHHFSVGWYF